MFDCLDLDKLDQIFSKQQQQKKQEKNGGNQRQQKSAEALQNQIEFCVLSFLSTLS